MDFYSNISANYESQKVFFESGNTLSLAKRKKIIEQIKSYLIEFKYNFIDAYELDTLRNESFFLEQEFTPLLEEIKLVLKEFKDWIKSNELKSNNPIQIEKLNFHSQILPIGNVILTSYWTCPFYKLISEIVYCLAAGNTILLNFPKNHPHLKNEILKLINTNLNTDWLTLIEGNDFENDNYYKLLFAHISKEEVLGKLLTGEILQKDQIRIEYYHVKKNIAIIDNEYISKDLINEIVENKCIAAGQHLFGLDAIYIEESLLENFLNDTIDVLKEKYNNRIIKNPNYGRLINNSLEDIEKHLQKEQIIYGGKGIRESNLLFPTIILNSHHKSFFSTEKIFAPIFNIYTFKSLPELSNLLKPKNHLISYFGFSTSFMVKENSKITNKSTVIQNKILQFENQNNLDLLSQLNNDILPNNYQFYKYCQSKISLEKRDFIDSIERFFS